MIIKKTYQLSFMMLCALVGLNACNEKPNQLTEHQLYVFGTMVSISVWHHDQEQANAAIQDISNRFNRLHQQWHAWKPGRLRTINKALRDGESVELNPKELAFMQHTLDLSQRSEGRFNPAIGELIHIWGFHTDEYPITTPPPDAATITSLLEASVDFDDVQIEGNIISSSNPHIWFDFGGIAKGYAVDLAIRILTDHEINNAIVNAGGDLRSVGSKGKRPWTIAIQSPKDRGFLATLQIQKDESVFTSGNYQRYKQFDGERYAHIINPATGWPVDDIVAATVIAEDGITADAAATAIVVAGSQWPEIAHAMGVKAALVVDDQDQCQVTSSMNQRLSQLTVNCVVINH